MNEAVIISDDDGQPGITEGPLSRLDPRYKGAYRFMLILGCVALWAVASVANYLFLPPDLLPWKAITALCAVALLLTAIIYPPRRYAAMGYRVDEDAILIARGRMFRSETLVPFARIQHLDIQRGPIERLFKLSSLHLSTAGSRHGIVVLPGLPPHKAGVLRAIIRNSIQREQP